MCARECVCHMEREKGYGGRTIIQEKTDKKTHARAHAQMYALLLF